MYHNVCIEFRDRILRDVDWDAKYFRNSLQKLSQVVLETNLL